MPKLSWSRYLPAYWIQGVVLILTIGVFPSNALAHRVLIYAYAEGDTIYTESKFVPDSPVRQGKILVMDKKTGSTLLTGQTDDEGKFAFKIPVEAVAEKLDLGIVVDAGMGHRGEWLLKADSYLAGAQPAAAPKPTPADVSTAPGTKAGPVDPQVLEALLNRALERQLGPINEKLTELTIHRTTPTDIIGGIGYILGIFGLAAYFLSKKKPKP
ncbi:hypothetical protein [Desulfobacca acetoxidans]|uniref:Nickel transport protein n=1 Tax=Desulfobacca acetoxidans (strain ATCC 700848 / DSM 11109 / ASRB2) TaxID=880072 RepID=F2NHB4_DESAR|nr:hypothetical protein [Desulfobacca acetoxidans]AEB08956.1 hypothetical protein Desac_1092 [Desulfobacca acetoxidans DSM 11109]